MLIDPTKELKTKNIASKFCASSIDASCIEAIPTEKQKNHYLILLVLLWILIIPGIILTSVQIIQKFKWKKIKQNVNNMMNNIYDCLNKRVETVKHIVDQIKYYLKDEEKKLFTNIYNMNVNTINSAEEKNLSLIKYWDILINTIKNNPNLNEDKLINELVNTSFFLEEKYIDIKYFYNKKITKYNIQILSFPNICYAAKMKLKTLPLFPEENIKNSSIHNYYNQEPIANPTKKVDSNNGSTLLMG